MMLLLDSALRSLLFGLLAAALLKLLRLRDTHTETLIWSAVLMVALVMPLGSHLLPQLPVHLPHLSAVPPQPVAAAQPTHAPRTSLTPTSLTRYARPALLAAYAAGLLLCLTRTLTGLFLTWRLFLRAAPVEAEWARGRLIRSSVVLKSPASMGWVILLPADYPEWTETKRNAVLAHEAAHIARGDFFVQLAASLHCAVFWFSPFAWWLRSKLAEIAETASDEAAIHCLNDRLSYAEILLEVARGAQPASLAVSMAKGPFIQQRLDRILSGVKSETPSRPLRVLVIGSLTVAALTLASARAAVDPSQPTAVSEHSSPAKTTANPALVSPAHSAHPAAVRHRRLAIRTAPHAPETPALAPDRTDEVSYNPRALLDPVYAFNQIRPSDRPVAEVSAVDGIYRQAR
jgi:beta-lactamase regulating signal transducer with metallopeptidase domain